METITYDEMVKVLIQKRIDAGSPAIAADELEISRQYFNDMIRGRRDISDNVARKLGYRRVMFFVKLEE